MLYQVSNRKIIALENNQEHISNFTLPTNFNSIRETSEG